MSRHLPIYNVLGGGTPLIFNHFDVYFVERFTHHLAGQCAAIRHRMNSYNTNSHHLGQ